MGAVMHMGPSLGGQAFIILKKKIISQEFGPGRVINIRDAERLTGSSAIPVREALMRLAECGLVEHISGRGFVVRELNLRDVDCALGCLWYIETQILRWHDCNVSDVRRARYLWSEGKALLAPGRIAALSMYDVHEVVLRSDHARTTRSVGRILLDGVRATLGANQSEDLASQTEALRRIFEGDHSKDRTEMLSGILKAHIDRLHHSARALLGATGDSSDAAGLPFDR